MTVCMDVTNLHGTSDQTYNTVPCVGWGKYVEENGRFKMSMHIKVSQLDGAMRLAYMAKHLREKMIFYILCGSCGQQFFQSVIRIQQADEIYEVNSWIKKNFRNSFTVEELAEQKNMSVSQFIRDYRKMFGQSPKEDISKLRCQLQEQVIFLEKQARK